MKIEKVEISKIHASAYNPRLTLTKDSKEYQHLRNSIETYGPVEPIVVNANTLSCIGGHQRLNVLKDLGYTEVDCVMVEIDDPTKEKALCVALNQIKGECDMTKLSELLSDESIQALETGFDEGEIDLTAYLASEDDSDEDDSEDDYYDQDEDDSEDDYDDEPDDYVDPDKGAEGTNGVCYFGAFRWKIPTDKYEQLMADIRSKGCFAKPDIVNEIIRRVTSD